MRRHDRVKRALVLTAFLSMALLGLGAKLAYMQVLEHDRFSQAAVAQRFHTVREDAPRGDIVDRKGRKLVSNRTAYRLQLLYPSYVQDGRPNSGLLGRLAALLGVDPARLEADAVAHISSRRFYVPLLVKDDLDQRELALLLELRGTTPGLYIDVHTVRKYPLGELGAHVLGHVGQIESQEQAEALGPGFQAGDVVGKMGVEKQYDQALRGTPGFGDMEVDAYFRPTGRTVVRSSAQPGSTLQLTLDLELQRQVEQALERTLRYVSIHPDWNGVYFPAANVGAAVVMDVRTGGILAMASYPTFNPNNLSAGGSFFNRAVSGEYLPGSTWKMLSGGAAMEYGLVDPHEKILCTGTFDKVEPKKDWTLAGHGLVDLVGALANSCNIYFYEMGYRLSGEQMGEFARRFGFGSALGIDLPDEATGWVGDGRSWKEKTGTILSAAIGQGPTATPLQLARYAAVIANGGVKVHPHIASALLDWQGQVVKDLRPAPDGRVQLSEGTFHYLNEGMLAVTDWGTSKGAFAGLPFKVAGKTGTAEVDGADNCAGESHCAYGVYVAFAPAENPEIAVAVVGERAGHGDSMNPVVRAAIAQYFGVNLAYNDPLYTMGILDRPAGLTPLPVPPRAPTPTTPPPTTPPPTTPPPTTPPPTTPPPTTPPPTEPPPTTPPPTEPPPTTPPPTTPPPTTPPPTEPPPTEPPPSEPPPSEPPPSEPPPSEPPPSEPPPSEPPPPDPPPPAPAPGG